MLFVVEEKPVEVFQKLLAMMEDHYNEVSSFKNHKLNPNWEAYQKLEDEGNLCVITLRDEDNDIVGYSVNFIIRHLHYNIRVGLNDIIYIKPEYRKYAMQLIATTEETMRRFGVDYVIISIKPFKDFSKLLYRKGYSVLETSYRREL